MARAHHGEWILIGEDVTPEQLASARKLLGIVEQQAQLGELKVLKRTTRLADGTTVTAMVGTTPPRVIVSPAPKAKPPGPPPPATLWLPRGFVVAPVSASSRYGVGLPVVQSGSDPYAPANLNPGLDVTRWTSGGPFNQVLLTKDVDAGYPGNPLAQPEPVFYGATPPLNAPYPQGYDARPTGDNWLGFRLSWTKPIQTFEGAPAGARVQLFSTYAGYRQGAALDQAYAIPRGFYRPGETLSYLYAVNGGNESSYPKGYTTEDLRLKKDGTWSNESTAYGELTARGGTAAHAVETWASTQPSITNLSSTIKSPLFADAGYCNGVWTLDVQIRDRWINAGRRVFQSSDAQLPPISWDGPPSKNLSWMTFPIVMHDLNLYAPQPITVDGRFWLAYFSGKYGGRPAIGPDVYCRGRTLGTLPNGGMVLGAGVYPLAGKDRLHVIAFHPSENAGLNLATQGMMAVAHVWWVDFPSNGGLRLHADAPVTEWQDGGTLTLPGIKYESFWEFSVDGTKAICLRDTATSTDIINFLSAAYPGSMNAYSGAFKGAVVELMISAQPSFSLRTTTLATPSYLGVFGSTWLKPRPGLYPGNPPSAPSDAWAEDYPLIPLAAGYDSAGRVLVAYTGQSLLLRNRTDPASSSIGYASNDNPGAAFSYFVTGGTSAVYPSDGNAVVTSQNVLSDTCSGAIPFAIPMVLDIPSRTFVLDGHPVNSKLTSYTVDPTHSDLYNYTYTPTGAVQTNALNTTAPTRRVRMFYQGRQVGEDAYGHPYGVLWDYARLTGNGLPVDGSGHIIPSVLNPSYVWNVNTSSWAIFVPSLDMTLQPFFAQRFGETIYGYQVGLFSPVTTMSFLSVGDPSMTDYAVAYHDDILQTITAENRPVVGGRYWSTFTPPDLGGGWLCEALVC